MLRSHTLKGNVSCLIHSGSLNVNRGLALETSITGCFRLLKKSQQTELLLAMC